MQSKTLKVVRIGNSKGIRLPQPLLARYRIKSSVVVEERPEGIMLKPIKDDRLSWEETSKAMAAEKKISGAEFSEFDATVADGLKELDK